VTPAERNADERLAQLEARLHSEDRQLTQAIIKAFRDTDWDDLVALTGDLATGLARLAAGVSWIEGKRAQQPNENEARQREARHRASVALVSNHLDEWAELKRTFRAEVDAERGEMADEPPAAAATADLTEGASWLRRLRDRLR
jgi:hypothetical protein